ncbi:MAG: PKD domain-containing protein [Cyclobacteriaceae bacterium]|nr:PKD domain-containing protein [Cyclobacteriaceae bacterium]
MKKTIFTTLLMSSLFFACNKEEVTPLVADFEVAVTGEAPNATLSITNSSTGDGLMEYLWKFSEGTDKATSELETPATLTVDKAGDFTVTLIVGDKSGEKELSKTVNITGNNAIFNYTGLELGYDSSITTYGRFFAVETGLVYKDDEITSDNGAKISLAFGSCGSGCYFFENPAIIKNGSPKYNIPNATISKVTNFENTPTISTAAFDAMADDALLSPLSITDTEDSFGLSQIPSTVLFETADGRKGVIKTNVINADRILVDIKVQKY